jgi:RNA polymerase sigma factor for flagellar operon FliA
MNRAERTHAVEAFFPKLRRWAGRVSRSLNAAVELDDLIGDGSVGLLRAIDTYDPKYGTTLEQYARRLCFGAMLNGLRRMDPVSERVRRTLRIADRERFARAQLIGRLETMSELERRNPKLRRAREMAFALSTLSLDRSLALESNALADATDEPAQHVVSSSVKRELRDAIDLLPSRQRQVMAMYYYGEQSLHAIGRRMKISAQRVSQIHAKALRRLRSSVIATP